MTLFSLWIIRIRLDGDVNRAGASHLGDPGSYLAIKTVFFINIKNVNSSSCVTSKNRWSVPLPLTKMHWNSVIRDTPSTHAWYDRTKRMILSLLLALLTPVSSQTENQEHPWSRLAYHNETSQLFLSKYNSGTYRTKLNQLN